MKQALVVVPSILPASVWGSSDEAWAVLRAAVQRSCRAALDAAPSAVVTIEVNPFGSESYGAMVTVSDAGGRDRMICIYDKQVRTAEVTAPFADAAPAE